MAHVGVLEGAHHQRHSIGLTDVPEEPVAQALAAARAAYEAGDVGERHRRRDDLGWAQQLGEVIQARIRHGHHPRVRIDGGERIVGHHRAGLCQRVEQSRFPGIR